MDKTKIEPLSIAYRLLNPGHVVLVSVGNAKQDNLFAVTWNIPAKKEPGMVAMVCGKRHFSYPLIEETREFGINIPDASLVDAVYGCGTTSGRDVEDKFERFGLHRTTSEHIQAPLVQEAIANLECRVQQFVDLGTASLIVGEIVAAVANPTHFKDGGWTFENGLRFLHHLSGDLFCVSNQTLQAKSRT